MPKENISIRIEPDRKKEVYTICESENVHLADIVRTYINLIIKNKTTKFGLDNRETENLQFIVNKIQEDHSKVVDMLKMQLAKKDEQLKTKDILIKEFDNKNRISIDKIKDDNNKIIELLKSQLEEKDKQLEQKNKLIENMQVLMKDNQQLLKEEQSKNVLLLEDKNKQSEVQNKSWFPFFKSKNV